MKKYFFFTLLVLLFLNTKSYALDLDFNDDSKTIRELKENIEQLDKTKDELYIKSLDFSPDVVLKSYFRDNLTFSDLNELKIIISDYNFNRKILESDLNMLSKNLLDTTIIRRNLLEEKKNLYKNITPFIKMVHYDDYINYIKSDTSLYSEKKVIDSSIIKKKEIISNKVGLIEEKIREHRTYIEDNLREIVNIRLDEKIKQLANNPGFIKLDNLKKIEILDLTLEKVQIEINNISSTEFILNTNSLQKKEIYNLTYQKLEDFKNSFKK